MTAQHTLGKLIFGIRGPMDNAGDSAVIPKPFDYQGPGYHDNPGLYAEDGTEVVGCGEYSIFSSGEDARRLVACWNACDGVPTEVLEAQMAGGLPWNVGNQIDKLADLAKAEAERDHARSRFDNAIKLLTGIHALLYPPVTKDANGQSWAFRPKNLDPHEIMQELSDRIRALPDEIDRAQAEAIGTNKEGD